MGGGLTLAVVMVVEARVAIAGSDSRGNFDIFIAGVLETRDLPSTTTGERKGTAAKSRNQKDATQTHPLRKHGS